MDRFHDEAERKNVHIVPTCGFDSIPFDLGAFMVAKEAESQGGAKWIKGFADMDGKPSGGTLHTILNLLETIPMRQMGNPHIMDPLSVCILILYILFLLRFNILSSVIASW